MGEKQEEIKYPKWIREALEILKPPERLTVSEWADKYRVLSEKDSASAGRWKTSKTPYLKEIMNALNDDFIEEIIFCGGSQLGKTVAEQNMIAYIIDQEPGPMVIAYPTDKLGEFTSENRIKPMIKLCPRLARKFIERESQKLELQFTNMYIAIMGANSESNLSSRPIRYAILDEVDKFPKWTGNEAGPIALLKERSKTFRNRKSVMVSTPTLKSKPIWQAWLNADLRLKYFVPCPHCGEFQEFIFKNIKFNSDLTPREIKYSTHYECEFCKGKIEDKHKKKMLEKGEWRAINKPKTRPKKVAYHLNSIYSPWLTFGDVAEKFTESKDKPEELMNFINSWLAEPWENKANKMKSDVVLEKEWTNERGRVPEEAQLLTMGVDVQKDHFWFAIRAWGPHITSWLIDYGRCETWGDITENLERKYATVTNGETREINLTCIDAGYDTDNVYQYCAIHQDKCVPTKGSSVPLAARFTVTTIDKYGLRLFKHDSAQFKDFIAGRLNIEAGEHGAWHVCKDCERLYADQICAEQKEEEQDKKGRITYKWKPISSHAQNHLLDCEVNAALAAEIMGVRYLMEPKPEPEAELDKQEDNWINLKGKKWL